MHDPRDSEDMPTAGWLLNIKDLAHREALGGSSSFDAYRADLCTFWKYGGAHCWPCGIDWSTVMRRRRAGDGDPSRIQVVRTPPGYMS